MKTLISGVKYSIFIILVTFAGNVSAEHYVACCETAPSVVYITCQRHHCSWSMYPPCQHRHVKHIKYHHTHHHHHYVKHKHKHHHYHYRYIDRYIERDCCSQDMATGDDNACLCPEMQIN